MSGPSEREEGCCKDEEIIQFLSNAKVSAAPCVKWEDIHGLQEAADKIKEYIGIPLKLPQLSKGTQKHTGCLLYGPPGSGKTMIVNAAIAEVISCQVQCYKLSAYDCLSRLQKNPVRSLQAMFKQAAVHKHCVVFVDDFEVLCQQREADNEMQRNLRTEFIQQVNDIRKNCHQSTLNIIGITNKPWVLQDDAEILGSILDLYIYTPLPDVNARYAIFKQCMCSGQHSLTNDDFRQLAEKSDGFSGSDLVVTAKDAQMTPVRKITSSTHFKYVSGPSPENPNQTVDGMLTPCAKDDPNGIKMEWSKMELNKLLTPQVTLDDVLRSLSECKPTESKETMEQYQRFRQICRTS